MLLRFGDKKKEGEQFSVCQRHLLIVLTIFFPGVGRILEDSLCQIFRVVFKVFFRFI